MTDGVHLAGQGALWAGLQDVSKHDLEKAEQTGFPIVLLILLAVFGSLAAARCRWRSASSRARHRRADLLRLAGRWRCRSS